MFKTLRKIFAAACLAACGSTLLAQAPPSGIVSGTWTTLTNTPPSSVTNPLLLTDGTVIVQTPNGAGWYKLTPDSSGSYVNGTWSAIAPFPAGYTPLYYASAVLADGRVVAIGGEYNGTGTGVWTKLGAIYNPVTNSWTPFAAPASWTHVGDAECAVLPNGNFMLADATVHEFSIFDWTTNLWTAGSISGRTSTSFDEEGWTLLPDGTVLTADVWDTPNASKYVIADNDWVSAGVAPAAMTSGTQGWEMGPAVLRPNGTVVQFGANGNNAVYTPPATPTDPGSWAAIPAYPAGMGADDAPACLLPDGNVLNCADHWLFHAPSQFYEYDGGSNAPVTNPATAASFPTFPYAMLMLPTGQVLLTCQTNFVQVYTPSGTPQDAWRPTITSVPSTVTLGADYTIQGTQFNGLSQCSAYGDDVSNATNYPLVRITNNGTGHVFYARTHGHSTMAVATGGTTVSTTFTVPAGMETGASKIQVIANGIASAQSDITVNTADNPPVADAGVDQTIEATGPTTSFTLDGTGSSDPDGDSLTYTWYDSSNTQVGTGSTLTLSRAVGVYTFKLTVSDGTLTDDDTVQITIQDTTPPAFGTLSDVYATASGNSGTAVTFGPFSATDLVDGTVAGTPSPASGSLFGPGSTLVTVSATDVAGNTGYGYFHVIVSYSWSGFLSPFPKQQYKQGSNIPIKFALTDGSSGITNLVAMGYWNQGGPDHLIGTFTYNPATGQYQLNWKTTGLPKGTYTIKVVFDDTSVHTIQIILK